MSYVFITHDSIDAELARSLRPGVGWCGRCGFPWGLVAEHVTHFEGDLDRHGSGRTGIFCVCNNCWEVLSHPADRMPYYNELMDYWEEIGDPLSAEARWSVTQAVAHGG